MGLWPLKKKVLETIGQYVNENKIPIPFRGGVPGDDFFICCKRMHKLSLKKPQRVEASQKKSIDPFIISAILLAASHAEGPATSLLLTVHADEIVSHPSSRVITISQNKTFEELLLDQVNQMPHVKTGRKRICGGVVVITSGEVSERIKETE